MVIAILAGAVLLGTLQLVRFRQDRKRLRLNPERQRALAEPVTFRASALVRFRRPNRGLLPNHWSYQTLNPMELVVRADTVQVSTTAPADFHSQSGWYFSSPDTSMRRAKMRFIAGAQDCIVLSGRFRNERLIWQSLFVTGLPRHGAHCSHLALSTGLMPNLDSRR